MGIITNFELFSSYIIILISFLLQLNTLGLHPNKQKINKKKKKSEMDKCSLKFSLVVTGRTKSMMLSSSSKESEDLQQATSTISGYIYDVSQFEFEWLKFRGNERKPRSPFSLVLGIAPTTLARRLKPHIEQNCKAKLVRLEPKWI